MTADTPMTDVDTSSEAIRKMQEDGGFYERWVDRADAQLILGKNPGQIHSFTCEVIVDADKIIDALSSRCDELERLANEMVERGNAMEADLRMLNNDRGGPVADRINRWYEAQLAFTAYQCKGE